MDSLSLRVGDLFLFFYLTTSDYLCTIRRGVKACKTDAMRASSNPNTCPQHPGPFCGPLIAHRLQLGTLFHDSYIPLFSIFFHDPSLPALDTKCYKLYDHLVNITINDYMNLNVNN